MATLILYRNGVELGRRILDNYHPRQGKRNRAATDIYNDAMCPDTRRGWIWRGGADRHGEWWEAHFTVSREKGHVSDDDPATYHILELPDGWEPDLVGPPPGKLAVCGACGKEGAYACRDPWYFDRCLGIAAGVRCVECGAEYDFSAIFSLDEVRERLDDLARWLDPALPERVGYEAELEFRREVRGFYGALLKHGIDTKTTRQAEALLVELRRRFPKKAARKPRKKSGAE
jgi:hypothetical protein